MQLPNRVILVVNPDYITVASYDAATCIAFTDYAKFLEKEKKAMKVPGA